MDFGTETQNIIRIFEDQPLLIPSDFDNSFNTTDDEDDDTKSIRSRVWKAKRQLNLTPGLPEDKTYSMREFIQGEYTTITKLTGVYSLSKSMLSRHFRYELCTVDRFCNNKLRCF